EPHVTLSEGNVAFALEEIFGETLGVVELDHHLDITLGQNPVEDSMTLLSNQLIDDASITIFDITGKNVLNIARSLNDRTTIPVNLESGMYVIDVETGHASFKTKLIVR